MAIEILEKLPRIANKAISFSHSVVSPCGALRAKRSSSMLPSRLTLARRSLAGHFTTFAGSSRQICSDLGVRLEVTEAVLNHVSGSRAGDRGRLPAP